MENNQKKDFIKFMINSKISYDHLKFFRNLEFFFKKKLNFKSVDFFSLITKNRNIFPRRIKVEPSLNGLKIVFTKQLLRNLKKKPYYLEKNKIWFLLGENESEFYLLQGIPTSKTKLDEDFLPIFLKFVRSSLNSIFEFQREFRLVDVDDVTGLYNQRRLHKDLQIEFKRYKDTKAPFSVLFIDIDHFKSVNDGRGHLVGSALLANLAKRLKEVLRNSDNFYRYGGDEFVIILPGVSSINGMKIGKRILKKIKEKPFKVDDLKESFFLSVSIGLATLPTHVINVKGLLDLADDMLYKAKELGRGRVCSVSEIFRKKK